jgi:hypothetical protein
MTITYLNLNENYISEVQDIIYTVKKKNKQTNIKFQKILKSNN